MTTFRVRKGGSISLGSIPTATTPPPCMAPISRVFAQRGSCKGRLNKNGAFDRTEGAAAVTALGRHAPFSRLGPPSSELRLPELGIMVSDACPPGCAVGGRAPVSTGVPPRRKRGDRDLWRKRDSERSPRGMALAQGHWRGSILRGVGQMFAVAITGVCRAVQV